MTTQHTPGPWRAGQTSSGAFIEVTYTTEQGVVEPIATCHQISLPRSSDQRAQAKANAEFIVRACNAHDDLLAALEALFTEAGEHAIDCGIEFAALEQARLAIAKVAKGPMCKDGKQNAKV